MAVLIVCVGMILWPKTQVDKKELIKYIAQKHFRYNRKYFKAITKLGKEGDQEVIAALALKYIETTCVRLLPDEKRNAEVLTKYRPYLKFQKLDTPKYDPKSNTYVVMAPKDDDIRFGLGITEQPLFGSVDILMDSVVGYEAIYNITVKELHRMRTDGVFDSDRVYNVLTLLRRKAFTLRNIDHRELTCELLYVYACYECWPSIRNDVHRVLGSLYGSASHKMLKMLDDEGLENALEYVDADALSKFKEAGTLHKKAPPPNSEE